MTSILDQPLVSFGRAICGDLPSGLRREWIVTNGLGGYASGTIAGPATRRYHGLLVAALTPPVGRTVLVGGLTDWATYGGQRWPLAAHEYGDGTLDPHGYQHLQSFVLEGLLPVWTFALADALLERRVWLAQGANTTYVRYSLTRASAPLELAITPLVTYRDFHTLTSGQGWRPMTELSERCVTVQAFESARPFRLLASAGAFAPGGDWWWNFHYREETARGLDDRADLYAPGTFIVTLQPGEGYTLVLTAEDEASLDGAAALAAARARQRDLLHTAEAEDAPSAVQQLVLAADQFIVARGAGVVGKTVIAGYHWFNDWGRDTMIALPGLTLATNRADDAADILRTFARYVSDGLLPNNFPDSSGAIPGYNTADATLWYFVAIHAYYAATGDGALVDDLLPTLRAIVDQHRAGTRYGIGVDPTDGLLRAGEPGVQLTWMDAKVSDWVVTPRIGKPVEINALWYNALRILADFLAARGDSAADDYRAQAERARESFSRRFIRPEGQGLFDVVDGPAGADASVRPNQIFAAALPFPLLDGADAEAVVAVTGRALLTTYGLRSLSPADPAYHGDYGGDQHRRDGAYHQGPVWPWLLGAYADAYVRVHDDPAGALSLVQPCAEQLRDAGLGSLSEILEGDPPHQPRGAIAQAWSVAEVLRVWQRLTGPIEH
jgi:predicted glycogen debranching enzyme